MTRLSQFCLFVRAVIRHLLRKISAGFNRLALVGLLQRRLILWLRSFRKPPPPRSPQPLERGSDVGEGVVNTFIGKGDEDPPRSCTAAPVVYTSCLAHPEGAPVQGDDLDDEEEFRSPVEEAIDEKLGHNMSAAIEGLIAIATKVEYERYEKNIKHPRVKGDYSYEIPALTRTWKEKHTGPLPWQTYIHPEGVTYYLKDVKSFRVLTEAPICKPDKLELIEEYIRKILNYITENSISIRKDTFLVLELRKSGRCGYYFVDHNANTLFWIDPFDFTELLTPVHINHTETLVALAMRSHYWYHNELFPNAYQPSRQSLIDLGDTITYSIGDVVTASATSVICYDLGTMKNWLKLIKHIQEQYDRELVVLPGATAFICRVMSNIYLDRYLNLHGEEGARLSSDQSIYEEGQRSLLLRLFFSPLMMYGPESHFRKLSEPVMDYMASDRAWAGSAEWIFAEWRDVALYAAVLLGANVGFLSIQSVDAAGQLYDDRRSNSQRASYFSIFTSLGSMFFSLLLLRHQRQTMNAKSIIRRKDRPFGLEALAVMYSLPYTMFLYSMLAFLLAFLLLWFETRDIYLISQSSVVCIFLLLILSWSIAITYGSDPKHSEVSLVTFGALTGPAGISALIPGFVRCIERLKRLFRKTGQVGPSGSNSV